MSTYIIKKRIAQTLNRIKYVTSGLLFCSLAVFLFSYIQLICRDTLTLGWAMGVCLSGNFVVVLLNIVFYTWLCSLHKYPQDIAYFTGTGLCLFLGFVIGYYLVDLPSDYEAVVVIYALFGIICQGLSHWYYKRLDYIDILWNHIVNYEDLVETNEESCRNYEIAVCQYNKITGRIISICFAYGEDHGNLNLVNPLEYSIPSVHTPSMGLFSSRKMQTIIERFETSITSIEDANKEIDEQTALLNEICKLKKPVLDIANKIEKITKDFIPNNLIKILVNRTKKETRISHALFHEKRSLFSGWGKDDDAKMMVYSQTTIEIYKQTMENLDLSNEEQKRQFVEMIKKH